ncbi:hypothetical protein ACFSYS_02940 [Christiangramia antarctica]|uniref:Uncharacterized protein n=1 Tax=Christiangramia antarctica TaxID=2058158 RepID=A0ABW5X1W4_9FLAO
MKNKIGTLSAVEMWKFEVRKVMLEVGNWRLEVRKTSIVTLNWVQGL